MVSWKLYSRSKLNVHWIKKQTNSFCTTEIQSTGHFETKSSSPKQKVWGRLISWKLFTVMSVHVTVSTLSLQCRYQARTWFKNLQTWMRMPFLKPNTDTRKRKNRTSIGNSHHVWYLFGGGGGEWKGDEPSIDTISQNRMNVAIHVFCFYKTETRFCPELYPELYHLLLTGRYLKTKRKKIRPRPDTTFVANWELK